jgi:hypothetical protein
VAIVVVDTGADECEAGTKPCEKLRARGAGAAVMPHLQDVPAPSVVDEELEQLVLTILLEVASEQGPLPAERQRQDDRCVIDLATRRRCDSRQSGERWPEHLDTGSAQPE